MVVGRVGKFSRSFVRDPRAKHCDRNFDHFRFVERFFVSLRVLGLNELKTSQTNDVPPGASAAEPGLDNVSDARFQKQKEIAKEQVFLLFCSQLSAERKSLRRVESSERMFRRSFSAYR